MKKFLSILFVFLFILSSFSGCSLKDKIDRENAGDNAAVNSEKDSSHSTTNAESTEFDFFGTDADMFTERDSKIDYDEGNAVTIKLNGTTAVASSDIVNISGSEITITEEATYVVSGELTDGMLIVNAPDTAKLQIVLNAVNITSKTSAALYIYNADKVFLTLAEGTVNTLANGGSFTAIDDNNIDAALFSKQDLTLNGTGSLTVISPAGHGIVSKDDLVITGGTYTVNSASHGLDANDSVRIINTTLNIDAGKDAIHAENTDDPSLGFIYIAGGTIHAEAESDGISAGAYLQISDGTIDLLVGGGSENGIKASSGNYGEFMGGVHAEMRPGKNQNLTTTTEDTVSMKGLKATDTLLISGGSITVNSADDSLHADASVVINGGTFDIASGDDAIHAEETLKITSGKIDVSECYEGLEALHIDVQDGEINLTSDDDGLNAAGGTDQSGITGGRDGKFGGGAPGIPGGHGGMSANSNGSITISGGTLSINASGDGIDANGTLEISGGCITVTGPTQGDTAILDYDKTAVITGGTFIGTGSAMMAQTFSNSQQGVIALSVGNQTAKTQISLQDSKGNTIITHSPALDFAVVILSTPELVKGEKYTVTVGTHSGEFAAI
ncbi:MAG: carbohydrate-binding domain-containing protein [Oscillospiraceae bacterium]|nr:carbohydrate-binding domain-containing protein [Oscillospiraceae bacterium]